MLTVEGRKYRVEGLFDFSPKNQHVMREKSFYSIPSTFYYGSGFAALGVRNYDLGVARMATFYGLTLFSGNLKFLENIKFTKKA